MVEVYVLARRTQAVVNRFRVRWASQMKFWTDEYFLTVRENGPRHQCNSLEDLIVYLLANPESAGELYWRQGEIMDAVRGAMLFFTYDGALIAGLDLPTGVFPESNATDAIAARGLLELAESVEGVNGLAMAGPPPPKETDFMRLLANADPPKLCDGWLIAPTPGSEPGSPAGFKGEMPTFP